MIQYFFNYLPLIDSLDQLRLRQKILRYLPITVLWSIYLVSYGMGRNRGFVANDEASTSAWLALSLSLSRRILCMVGSYCYVLSSFYVRSMIPQKSVGLEARAAEQLKLDLHGYPSFSKSILNHDRLSQFS